MAWLVQRTERVWQHRLNATESCRDAKPKKKKVPDHVRAILALNAVNARASDSSRPDGSLRRSALHLQLRALSMATKPRVPTHPSGSYRRSLFYFNFFFTERG